MPENTPVEERGKTIRRLWFCDLPEVERDGVIERHFNETHPTNESKREVAENYGRRADAINACFGES